MCLKNLCKLSNEVLYKVLSQGASELPKVKVKSFKKFYEQNWRAKCFTSSTSDAP